MGSTTQTMISNLQEKLKGIVGENMIIMMNSTHAKLKEILGADEIMKYLQVKLKELRLMVESSGYFSMGWLDKVFPPETRNQYIIPPWLLHGKAPYVVSVLAGLLLLWYCCSSTKGGKTMKAPGRKNVRMRRTEFEDNPKGYFRDLHGSKRKNY
ncbi:hypothetical protein ACH5RR_035979 [Cinchona calisaya]|uniref:Uncharacterized protein n=1 Tax=Cinchona calisaya TaxID=153742 RepID=A0ABD2Y400_9GENT